VAVNTKGIVALGIGYAAGNGYTSGIRWLDLAGKEIRFVETGRYVPIQLAFDKNGNLWSMGWERDQLINDSTSNSPWSMVHKYSAEGKLIGEFLPTTLWTEKHGPDTGGRGYWTMYAANERIGAVFNGNSANATPEWVEWDLDGSVLRRIPLPSKHGLYSRAFAGNGRLYAQFPVHDGAEATELKVLETATGNWTPLRSNLPGDAAAYLLGAEGDDLVYRLNRGGNMHLVWARPE